MDEFRDIQNLLFLYLVGNDLSLKKTKKRVMQCQNNGLVINVNEDEVND